MRDVPEIVEAHGRAWTVERAWPAVDGGCDIEVTASGVAGVRAGRWRDGVAEIRDDLADRRLPGLAPWAARGEVVSWRRGRRAVVRAGHEYVKIVRPSAAASVVRAHREADAFRRGFAVPEPRVDAADEADGVVRLSRLPGRTLCELGADRAESDGRVERGWEAWAAGWSRVLAHPALPATRHTGADEAAVLRRWMTAAAGLTHRDATGAAGVGAAALGAADRVGDALRDDAGAAFAVSHRDLHDKQVLVGAGDAAGLLDLDTATAAEPALDLGNLRAHVAWRQAQGRLSPARAAIARRIIDRVARDAGVDAARLAVYDEATRLRLGAVYLFRPASRRLATAWLSAAGGLPRVAERAGAVR